VFVARSVLYVYIARATICVDFAKMCRRIRLSEKFSATISFKILDISKQVIQLTERGYYTALVYLNNEQQKRDL